MEFQTLKGSRNKKIIIGVIVFITIISMILIGRSYASYRTTQSINIANGTVNYKVPDLRLVAVKLQSENNSEIYNDSDSIPTSGYTLNTSKSVCGQPDGNGYAMKDNSVILTYDNGVLLFNGLKKSTRCYLYFDKQDTVTSEDIIANYNSNCSVTTNGAEGTITGIADTNEGICKIQDGMYGGTTYYYRGAIDNNWVKFGNFYWRIIRFNGDGSIRLIYTGREKPSENEKTVMTGDKTILFTGKYNDDLVGNTEKTGYYYTLGETHGNNVESNIATNLKGWFKGNLSTYSSYLADGKFCNDRTIISGTGIGNDWNTFYAPYLRVYDDSGEFKKNETFTTECTDSLDIFTESIGLLTLDEILMAGGFGSDTNTNYYLYTDRPCWTMSPRFNHALFMLGGEGSLTWNYFDHVTNIRPVINLKAGTTFTGSGTYDDVYKVVGTSD